MIYLDSGVIMRLLTGSIALQKQIVVEIGGESIVTSAVSIVECLCRPLRLNDTVTIDIFNGFFTSLDTIVVNVDARIAHESAKIRAASNLKTPDSIHAATAILQSPTKLLTTDRDFVKLQTLAPFPIVILQP